jgi:hypothetical protein
MIKIQAHPNFINQLRIFDWSENLQVDWYDFLDYCRFSNLATILVEDMTIIFFKTSSSTDASFEWRMTKPFNEPFPDELIYIMDLRKYDLEFISKIQKDKLSGIIYGTYFKMLNNK